MADKNNTLKVTKIGGMENVRLGGSLENPRHILNMDVMDVVKKRAGFTLVKSLPGCRSIFAVNDEYLLALANGSVTPSALWKVYPDGTSSELGGVDSVGELLSAVNVDGKVYMSSGNWTGKYDTFSGIMTGWGVTPPLVAPIATVSEGGGLPKGRYGLTFTAISNGELSGNGPVTYVDLANDGAINVTNAGPTDLLWVSGPQRDDFTLVEGTYIGAIQGIEMLPSFGCSPPSGLKSVCFGGGRIWGSSGSKVFYSEPYGYSWFKTTNFLPFPENVTSIAPVDGGFYVHTQSLSFFVSNWNPKKATVNLLPKGTGAVEGSLSYSKIGDNPVLRPVWLSRYGIVAGGENGVITRLTENRVRMDVGRTGATHYKNVHGEDQIIAATGLPDVAGFGDSASASIIRNGVLYEGEYDEIAWTGVNLNDSASATIS